MDFKHPLLVVFTLIKDYFGMLVYLLKMGNGGMGLGNLPTKEQLGTWIISLPVADRIGLAVC